MTPEKQNRCAPRFACKRLLGGAKRNHPMTELEQDDASHKLANVEIELETLLRHTKRIKADALRDAAAMNCVNHVPACNCDVCAFTKRILTAAQTLDASAAQPNS